MADDAEFRLHFERGATPTSYRVETSGAGGERTGSFELPFSSIELENYILRFGRTRQTVRRIDSPEMDLARTFGGKLFLALTTGPVGEGFRVAQGVAQGGGRNLRVTLSMTEAPELAAIPWEFLYDDPSFLATSARTPVVRCLEVERPAQPYGMTLPLRILAVESLPKGAAALATGSERALLTAALKTVTDLGAVQCDWLPDGTLTSLNRQLRSQDYHILHFIGHGGFDKANKEGALLFEDENGLADLVGGDRLAAIVGERQSLRLVVLNSCEGARSDVSDPFSGVAGRLIERDVPAVIGMQFEITDRAAILFAREFYTVLAEGHAVDTAVSEARLAILADQNDVEWATPALFMRGSDAHLFSITDAAPIERVAPPLPPRTEGGGGGGTTRGVGLPAWFRARPLAMPLLLAIVAILVVAVVAVVLLNGASTAALHLTTFPDRPGEMIVTGSGFREGETVELTMDGLLLDRVSVDPGGQFTKRVTRPDTVLPGHFLELVATGLVSGRKASEFGAFGASPGSSAPPPSQGASTESVSLPPSSPPSLPPSSPPTAACRPPGVFDPSILFVSDVDVRGDPAAGSRLFCLDPETGGLGQVPIVDPLDPAANISSSTWAPAGGDIAITLERAQRSDRDVDILTSVGRIEPLVDGRSDDFFPAWSVAGDIAFVRVLRPADATPFVNSQIMVIRRGETDPVAVASGLSLRTPAWSADGTQLAFIGKPDGRSDYDIGEITFGSAPVDRAAIASAPPEVRWVGVPGFNELNPAWSADGRLAYVRDTGTSGNKDNDIFVASPDLVLPKQRTGVERDDGTGVQDGNPVWSSDSARIAFYRATDGGFHIWVMNRNGSNQRDLMEGRRGRNLDPSWR